MTDINPPKSTFLIFYINKECFTTNKTPLQGCSAATETIVVIDHMLPVQLRIENKLLKLYYIGTLLSGK